MLTLGPSTSDTPPQLKNSVRLQLRCECKPDVLRCQVGAWTGKLEDLLSRCSRKLLVPVLLKVLAVNAFVAVYRLSGLSELNRFGPAQWLFISAVDAKGSKMHVLLSRTLIPAAGTNTSQDHQGEVLIHCFM